MFKVAAFRLDEDEFATAWLQCQSLASQIRPVETQIHTMHSRNTPTSLIQYW